MKISIKALRSMIKESLILEGRLQDAKKKYGKYIAEDIIDALAELDPSKNLKYLDWTLKTYLADKQEIDLESYMTLARKFDELSSSLPRRDIYAYKSYDELRQVIKVAEKQSSSKPKMEKIYEDNNVLVVFIKNYAASCKYGANTKWCVTAKNNRSAYDTYSKTGDLFYFMISKTLPRNDPKAKIAIRYERNQKSFEYYNSLDVVLSEEDVLDLYPSTLLKIKMTVMKRSGAVSRGQVESFNNDPIETATYEDTPEALWQVYSNMPAGKETDVIRALMGNKHTPEALKIRIEKDFPEEFNAVKNPHQTRHFDSYLDDLYRHLGV